MSKELAAGIVKRVQTYNVDPTTITRRAGFNPRFDFGEIDLLAKSIAANGLLMPLRIKRIEPHVKPTSRGAAGTQGTQAYNFELVDGDRRLTAIEKLLSDGHAFPDGVPATLVERAQDDLTSLIQMFEANTGKAFLPLEEAAAFKRMRDAGMTVAQICSQVGRTDAHVIDTLALLEADDDVKEAVANGAIGGSIAKTIATTARGDKALQKALVVDAKAAKGKGADAEAAKARLQNKLDEKKKSKAAARGKAVRIHAITAAQLSELTAKVARLLVVKAKAADWDSDDLSALLTLVSADDCYTAAYTLGALHALQAAGGLEVNLDI